jgi:hypothetical protein
MYKKTKNDRSVDQLRTINKKGHSKGGAKKKADKKHSQKMARSKSKARK